ncbi:hypothetical protein ACOT7R_07990 [Clostridium perfringens]|uniref:Uncharacterized protein n=1 Tax=Clostridium perfringens TaxID=1502 RepID=A0A8H9QY17_CLOPF|nr:hypothetical protein [Clostridium perfringens]MDK0980023.1 hypothetical protein [Clostridium perfringens]MDU3020045.1 hypothetical protein [Clostridium perfringens]HAT4308227.1 hypothetical protein [Clostridium perfringens]
MKIEVIGINKSNKITIIGYIVSLLSFIGAFFFFISKIKNYGDMFLVAGGIILTVTSIYKLITTELKNQK